MAARAYWKGYLKLSLVSCPVKLFAATSTSNGKISFNYLHKETHNRVQMRYHDPELGEVSRDDLVKGYQFEKDRYVIISPEEMASIQIESNKTITIEGFVDDSEIDPIYYDNPYFLAPDGRVAEETYAVILEAMRRENKVALARIVLSQRERMIAIAPKSEGFLMTTLRTAKEVRDPALYFEPLKTRIDQDMLQMAEQIIAQKSMPFQPENFVDQYEEALLDLVKAKIAGEEPIVTQTPDRPANVVNLFEALKQSLEAERRPAAPSKTKAPARGGRRSAEAPAVSEAAPIAAKPKRAPAKSRAKAGE